ncbi:short-chain fatty acyl-CoA regulator family protein [Rhizobium sp. SSA_523]|uniref:helix-turn-helix domain-containing protein n=1 Tax=Rhizobium sp. SSA_523 TaxID=2952477 RepID=UPI002091208F|nr:helix-turn-helix transcriptional regulator [Rhizobium sp. SSA_523]MCO5733626.1 short-chain fatty acyl-CoA regulator family protein [Rhizobium sp. SSA_523]WKC23078.1 short-chain fatty acyl-CoA regulator family protein [Rhizobium sp. SSA_523]
MAGGKLYIGRKVRDLRETAKATQSQFAERLGISTSYLNQIENNQRPVSAAVLLALAEKFGMSIADLSSGEGDRLLSALTEALSDPLFDGNGTSLQELKLVTQNAPGLAHALIAAHQAYRRSGEQLASMDDRLGRGALQEATPYDEVRDYFHFVDNYIHDLDVMAERLAGDLGLGGGDNHAALQSVLLERFGVAVERTALQDDLIRRFDPASRRLSLNAYAAPATRDFQMALQIAQLHAADTIDRLAREAGFRTAEAMEICRIGLQNYFAGALLLPYETFLKRARALRHDLDLLAAHFGASLEQVCHRLSTLQRPGQKGVPIFFARVDRAGNITKRHSAAKLQFARFGAACPLWNVHQAFEMPGRIIRQLAETPDGMRYLCLATQITKGSGGFRAVQPRYALALGCEISYADSFVYADDLDLANRAAFEPIGISCRICERHNCPQRAMPPLRSRLSVDHDNRSIVPYRIV